MAPTEAVYPCQVGAVDFFEDKLVSGWKVRILNVMDIFSRDVLGSLVKHSITGEVSALRLAGLFLQYGAPGAAAGQRLECEAKVFQRMLLA